MMEKLQLKVPPVLAAFIIAAAIFMTARVAPVFSLPPLLHRGILLLAMVGGGIIAAWALLMMKAANTTINPYNPKQTTVLIEHGIYAYTRNPMYLSLAIGLLGLCGYWGTLWGVCWVIVFIAFITQFQIIPEEESLRRHFPRFSDYCHRVRRWL